jgi:hypothetical protein
VAATGLLGINPYQKGINLDFTSKPAQLSIQLEQKEQAKREALDKYFMDYEKSLNPAGMRNQDQDVFLGKLAQAKQLYLQNRDKILNPTKYGSEAQSQYLSALKDAQTAISLSKQAMAQDKLTTQHFISQKNLNAPDGYAEAVELSHLPINDPRYRPLDVTQWKFYKSYNPMEYANKIYSKLPLSESAPVAYDVEGQPGRFYTKTVSKVDPKYKDALLQQGYTDYQNDEGLRKEMNHIFDNNKAEVKRLEEKYGTKIPNAQVLAGVHLWDLQPVKENTSDIKITPEYQSKLIASRQKNKPTAGADAAKFLEGGVTALKTGNINFINDYFKPWKAQTKTGTTGDIIGFQNIDVLPDGKIKVNYSIPMSVTTKSGVSATVANKQSRILDPNSTSLLQEITALHQELLGSNVKAEGAATSNLPKPPTDVNTANNRVDLSKFDLNKKRK